MTVKVIVTDMDGTLLDETGDRVPVAFRVGRHRVPVRVAQEWTQLGGGRVRRDVVFDKHCQPGVLDGDQRIEECAAAHQRAGAMVTRPEEVGHGRCPG